MKIDDFISRIQKFDDKGKTLSNEDIEREKQFVIISLKKEELESNKQDREERKNLPIKYFECLYFFFLLFW